MKKIIVTIVMALAAAAVSAQQLGGGLLRNRLRQNGPQTARSVAAAPQAGAQEAAASSGPEPGGRSIEFNQTPVDLVFKIYGDLVDRTVLKDPQTPTPAITIQPRQGQVLSDEEKIEAIETVLEMNGIHMEKYGEKFVRALPRKTVRQEGIPLKLDPDAVIGESQRVISLMLPFKNIAIEEAQKALEGFKSANGILLVFERTNSILVTDTEANISRMREIAKAIDIATPVTEVVEYIQIKYANANDVKQVIDNIVQEAMKEQEKDGKKANTLAQQPQQPRPPLLGGGLLRRPGQQPNQPAAPANNASMFMSVSDADRGMIRGKVVTIADERSNKILIITNQANMKFFKDVIAALDVETTPDTVVKVYRLKYADAEDVSDMINDLIGNSSSSKSSGKANQNQNAKNGQSGSVTRPAQTQAAKKPANQRTGEAKAGELNKENTTVLADKRINGLVVMTTKELVPTIEQIIESMDVKLSQVLIETVIIEVGLGDGFSTGIDWVKGMQTTADGQNYRQAIGGGGGTAKSVVAGATTNALSALIDGSKTVLPSIFAPGTAGLSYALFLEELDLSAVISASKSDSRAKYLASPVIMTVDNKEATIEATESRKFYSGSSGSSGGYTSTVSYNYSDKDLGITIKVTPKINPNGTVMLKVDEEYSQLGAGQTVLVSNSDGSPSKENVDTALTRKMSADVILENRQTVVLGGLTEKYTSESESGIPILKDIPYVGKWLFGSVKQSEDRKELLVFMTPYVLTDGEAAQAEAIRRKKSLSDVRAWDDNGWSDSALADPVSKKEQMRRLKDEWKKQDEDRRTKLAVEQEKVNRAQKLQELSVEERNLWLKMHKEELEEEQQEEFEKKMLDKDSQEELKKLAEQIRAKKLESAEKELESMEDMTRAENERAKLDAEKKAKTIQK